MSFFEHVNIVFLTFFEISPEPWVHQFSASKHLFENSTYLEFLPEPRSHYRMKLPSLNIFVRNPPRVEMV